MSAYGFTAFVDGFFKGREYRDSREDRKREIERQKRMDDILAQRETRAAERHGIDMESGRLRLDADKLSLEEARRKAATEEEYRRIMREGMEDPSPDEPLGARPSVAKSGTPAGEAAVAGVAANLPMPGVPTRAADAFVRAVPLESLGAKKQTQAGGAGVDTLAGGDEGDSIRSVPARSQSGAAPPSGMPSRPDGTIMAPAPSAAIADELYLQGPVGARFIPPERQVSPSAAPPVAASQPAAPAPMMPALQPPQLDRRAQFEPPVDPGRPSELVTFSPDQIRKAAQPAPSTGPSLGARVKDALKPGLDTWAGAMQPNYDHQFGQPGGLLGDASEVILRAPRVAGAIVTGTNDVVDNTVIRPALGAAANAVNRAVNPALRYAAGVEAPLVENAPFGPGSMIDRIAGTASPPPAPAAPPASDSPPAPAAPLGARPAPPASQPNDTATPGQRLGPTVEAAKQAEVKQAAQSIGPAAAVAVEEAQKVANAPLGATDRQPLSPKQRDRAATSAMDRYITVVVPKLIEAMVKNGDIERAVKFQEFMEAAETKRAMKDYAHMVVAAGEQDIETFGKHLIAAYNRLGYYNDGTTIVPEQSRFTTDESGAVNGAVITFRNEETGDTYERVYDDPNQLYMVGLAAADPLNAFTETASRIKAANEAALGARKAARDEVREAAKERQKNIHDAAKLIFEQSAKNAQSDMLSFDPKKGGERPRALTFEEAREEARRAYPEPDSEPPATPPPLLRPN